MGWYDEFGIEVETLTASVGDRYLTAKWEKSVVIGEMNHDDEHSDTDNTVDDGANNNNNNDDDAEIESRPNTYVNSGDVDTGDNSNVMRLIVVCVICALIMFLLLAKRKKDDEEEEQEQKENKKM